MKPPPLIIGASGRRRAGKDTLFCLVRDLLPSLRVHRHAFADAIKHEAVRSLRHGGWNGTFHALEAAKESYRPLLQWWGVWRRDEFGDDYWIRRLAESVAGSRADVVVVTDVRFPNEQRWIESRGGVVWRVTRPPTGVIGTVDLHVSEAVEGVACDVEIANDGTLEDYRRTVAGLLRGVLTDPRGDGLVVE